MNKAFVKKFSFYNSYSIRVCAKAIAAVPDHDLNSSVIIGRYTSSISYCKTIFFKGTNNGKKQTLAGLVCYGLTLLTTMYSTIFSSSVENT